MGVGCCAEPLPPGDPLAGPSPEGDTGPAPTRPGPSARDSCPQEWPRVGTPRVAPAPQQGRDSPAERKNLPIWTKGAVAVKDSTAMALRERGRRGGHRVGAVGPRGLGRSPGAPGSPDDTRQSRRPVLATPGPPVPSLCPCSHSLRPPRPPPAAVCRGQGPLCAHLPGPSRHLPGAALTTVARGPGPRGAQGTRWLRHPVLLTPRSKATAPEPFLSPRDGHGQNPLPPPHPAASARPRGTPLGHRVRWPRPALTRGWPARRSTDPLLGRRS